MRTSAHLQDRLTFPSLITSLTHSPIIHVPTPFLTCFVGGGLGVGSTDLFCSGVLPALERTTTYTYLDSGVLLPFQRTLLFCVVAVGGPPCALPHNNTGTPLNHTLRWRSAPRLCWRAHCWHCSYSIIDLSTSWYAEYILEHTTTNLHIPQREDLHLLHMSAASGQFHGGRSAVGQRYSVTVLRWFVHIYRWSKLFTLAMEKSTRSCMVACWLAVTKECLRSGLPGCWEHCVFSVDLCGSSDHNPLHLHRAQHCQQGRNGFCSF